MKLPHWDYFLTLEDDLLSSSRFVAFEPENFATFSTEFSRIILMSASEVDTVLKILCKEIDPTSKPHTIVEYHPIITSKFPNFTNFRTTIRRYDLDFEPWIDWTSTNGPDWWSKCYNKIKHERDLYYNKATLKNAILSCSALLGVLLYFYELKFGGQLTTESFDAPKFFFLTIILQIVYFLDGIMNCLIRSSILISLQLRLTAYSQNLGEHESSNQTSGIRGTLVRQEV